jgi:two-component system phosphate regulon sensor histidine kinase PhoR
VVGITFALVVLGDIIGGVFLEQRLRHQFETEATGELHRVALITEDILSARLTAPTREHVDELADHISPLIGPRVTIMNSNGDVLGDSSLDGEELRTIDNHANRPEVRGALATGEASSTRYSATIERDMLYLARSYAPQSAPSSRMVIRVARPLSELDEQILTLRYVLLFAGLLTLIPLGIAGTLASAIFSRRFSDILATAALRASPLGTRAGAQPVDTETSLSGTSRSFLQVSEDLEKAMNVLADERDRFQVVLESMQEGVLALDAEGRVSLANRAARSLLGLDDDVHGKSLQQLTTVEEIRQLGGARIDESTTVEFAVAAPVEDTLGPSANAPRRTVHARATIQSDGGRVIVMHDVTEIRRLETIRRDFVANVSHELRTPVSIIRANAETLLSVESDRSSQERRFIEALLRHADRLGRLITDLLDISKIEVGKYPITPQCTKLALLARSSMEAVEQKASKKRMTLACEIPEDLAAMVDAKALEQVMVNLTENAVKYATEECSLVISAKMHEDRVLLEFADDGPGIEPIHRPRIFERFYRVDPGRSREMGGTGLGLAIVKHLVEAMDGSVGVVANEPRGSRFWVSLPPVAAAPAPSEERADSVPALEQPSSGRATVV